jgi:transposase-like protein
MTKHRIAPDVKEQIINRIKNEGVTVVQAAKEHGVNENTIYAWLAKKVEGQPTLAENIKLKRENAQLFQLIGELTLKLSEAQKKK